ncbi:MAG: hypothetical protein GXZ09_05815 [Syntrophomonadaceae bacterium]|jgi:hypothetical protein|nr:hypothetical protein [Syntrophomonadaceae bacterium]
MAGMGYGMVNVVEQLVGDLIERVLQGIQCQTDMVAPARTGAPAVLHPRHEEGLSL